MFYHQLNCVQSRLTLEQYFLRLQNTGSDAIFIDQDRDENEITEISSIPRNFKVLVFEDFLENGDFENDYFWIEKKYHYIGFI